mmetsp:Transcript_8092/g.17671  ORF Transcript_8092/g.17671 Transcript_8092/m.17671 type:complete len:262 (-) Transcript_8092:790-1575(-)
MAMEVESAWVESSQVWWVGEHQERTADKRANRAARMLAAVRFGQHDSVAAMLANGAMDANCAGEVWDPFDGAPGGYGVLSALELAAARCDGRMLRILLDHGADPARNVFSGRMHDVNDVPSESRHPAYANLPEHGRISGFAGLRALLHPPNSGAHQSALQTPTAVSEMHELLRKEQLARCNRHLSMLRCLSFSLNRACEALLFLYAEVHYRPGSEGQRKCQSEFEMLCASLCCNNGGAATGRAIGMHAQGFSDEILKSCLR